MSEQSPIQPALLEARDLVKDYGAVRVVDRVSLDLRRGETLGLVGESGSGKSTVARMLLRLIEPSAGSILLRAANGEQHDLCRASARQMRAFRRRMAMVFQDPYAALNPRMTVRQILSEPFQIHGALRDEGPHLSNEDRLGAMLEEVGLDGSALRRYPHEFSGGQRQRINIARALALRPEILILDEPVSALDVSIGAQVINLLRDLQQRYGLTYLFISHSMPLVRYLCHRVIVMQLGRIVESGDWRQVCEGPQESYTQQLLAATPELPCL